MGDPSRPVESIPVDRDLHAWPSGPPGSSRRSRCRSPSQRMRPNSSRAFARRLCRASSRRPASTASRSILRPVTAIASARSVSSISMVIRIATPRCVDHAAKLHMTHQIANPRGISSLASASARGANHGRRTQPPRLGRRPEARRRRAMAAKVASIVAASKRSGSKLSPTHSVSSACSSSLGSARTSSSR